MKVTFRCKRSGNTVSFTNESDIAGLRKHEGYEEVKDENKAESESGSNRSDGDDEKKGNEEGNEGQKEVLEIKVAEAKRRGRKPKK